MTLNSSDRKTIINYRLEKAENTFSEAVYSYEGGHFNLAINRLYYSLFYAVTALLLSEQFNTTTHAGAKSMFHLHFVKNNIFNPEEGNLYNRLLQMRNTGDYDDFFNYTLEDVETLISPVKSLLNKIIAIINTKI